MHQAPVSDRHDDLAASPTFDLYPVADLEPVFPAARLSSAGEDPINHDLLADGGTREAGGKVGVRHVASVGITSFGAHDGSPVQERPVPASEVVRPPEEASSRLASSAFTAGPGSTD